MKFDNSFLQLGEQFYRRNHPESVSSPALFLWNASLADELGFDNQVFRSDELAQMLCGNRPIPGAEPVALAYAGHQFGNFVPQLGDGRAHLLGEIIDRQQQRRDLQLKGSGPTDFSRNGDGRYALGPAIREFIMSEFVHALGIPTARSLAVCKTGETVFRDSPQEGAVVSRIAASHIRVGTFEYLAARNQHEAIVKLVDYVIARHYPHITETGTERVCQLLEAVMSRQIDLVVAWLRVGFIHGVLNTDNTTISGETIDFGPCAMINHYDPETVFSSIDRQGRYAFGNQPTIISWNMARLAETLLPVIDTDEKQAIEKASAIIQSFSDHFLSRYHKMMSEKLGLIKSQETDQQLVRDLLELMHQHKLDYTITFNQLTRYVKDPSVKIEEPLHQWLSRWQQRLDQQDDRQACYQCMRQNNPLVIARNHHMEAVLAECLRSDSADAAEDFLKALRSPYAENQYTLKYQDAPADGDINYKTFCGT